MSSSVKLQILRSLDATTRLNEGMDWFLGQHHLQKLEANQARMAMLRTKPDFARQEGPDSTQGDNKRMQFDPFKPTGYQRLLEIMSKKQVCSYTCI